MFKPKGAQAVARAGQLYQAGKKAEALQMALSGAKGDPAGWPLAASIALELQRYSEALEAAEHALKSSPTDPGKAVAWNAKGQALAGLDRMAEARACFAPAQTQPMQALTLAAVLAFRPASDAPPRRAPVVLSPSGIRAWFPGATERQQHGGHSTFSQSTSGMDFKLACKYLPADQTEFFRTLDPEKLLTGEFEKCRPRPPCQLLKLEIEPERSCFSYAFFDPQLRLLQLERVWYDLGNARQVQASITIADLKRAADPEPGHFLNLIDLTGPIN